MFNMRECVGYALQSTLQAYWTENSAFWCGHTHTQIGRRRTAIAAATNGDNGDQRQPGNHI